MELATALRGQTVQNKIREVGINPNYWYPVGWSDRFQPNKIVPVVIWHQAIAVYRDAEGHLHALENACPHRGVELHKGKVHGTHLACPYHGWEFSGSTGECVNIPYLPKTQKLPCAQARTFPIQEKYGLVWVFPGDRALSDLQPLPEAREFEDPDWLMVPVTAHFKAHFSICNENAMDVFHGFLHEDLQGWFDPVLTDLKETESMVRAEYQVSYKGHMAKFLGLTDRADQVTTLPIAIQYSYPHYATSLQGISALYLMRLPISPVESRSFALFFFKVRLPKWVLRSLRPILSWAIPKFLLQRFLDQDVDMMESEQQTYLKNPRRRYVEINPAIIALQRLIVRQYEQFSQQPGGSPSSHRPTGSQSSEDAPSAGDLPQAENLPAVKSEQAVGGVTR
ncbi:MAG: aromatic ring-hydroxylating dioxygenase subunit alpha [Drouetiella hepatica Uher 2000/2452]|jgi:phenylpropionate dioxygenase-like ring-hydroxylating dioxygenase large terminal subunit|uniref:Aromatic ring-hydroxylating dioxygenase subunit alpha n=1 Tax=Drouetiella hepatica Uher 2000/2452 TaxID=904376 RepID=A0A951UP19_9CYAN|nr:aromatic ring-hydroxylating dioxygenase subunit alpha [Drouetiella hepatica Uher 2000/2452]